MIKEFRDFILRGNVLDLAVAVIMGAAFGTVVTSLVRDVLMPPIGLLIGGVDFSEVFISLKGAYPSLAAAKEAGAPTINVGVFLNTVINFLLVALSVFSLLKIANTAMTAFERKKQEAAAEAAKSDPLLESQRELTDAINRLTQEIVSRR